MYNLLLSLAAGALTAAFFHLLKFPWLADVLPGVLVALGAFVALARRVAKKVQALAEQAQGVLQSVRTEKERNTALDKAIKIFEQGHRWDRWQFLIGAEVHANIGMLLYLKKDFEQARPHLERAFSRNWMAKAMLGCIHYMAKNVEAMKAQFEQAVTSGGRKEGLAWSVYAYCLWKLDLKDQALAVLIRAVKENPSDEKLKKNLIALQNGKRLKMSAYEPMWWQFHLEKPPPELSGQPRVRFQRR